MSQGPENRFINTVHDKFVIGDRPHYEKMHNPYRGGTADVWYSGNKQDAWVEYKWLNRVPKRGVVKPKLEPLQREWLRDRYNERRTVFVIVGCPAGGIIFDQIEDWENGIPVSQITIMPKRDIAEEITNLVGITSEKTNAESGTSDDLDPTDPVVNVQGNSSGIPAVRVAKVSIRKRKTCGSSPTTTQRYLKDAPSTSKVSSRQKT